MESGSSNGPNNFTAQYKLSGSLTVSPWPVNIVSRLVHGFIFFPTSVTLHAAAVVSFKVTEHVFNEFT